MLPSEALAKIEKDSEKVVDNEALKLYADLKLISPIDTGFFKGSWKIDHKGTMKWTISNNAEYADVLARGRRGNRGSKQWEHGLSPMLQKTDKEIQRGLDAIRY